MSGLEDVRQVIKLLEKAGFRREGVLRRAVKIARYGDTPQDAVIYSQVRDDLGR